MNNLLILLLRKNSFSSGEQFEPGSFQPGQAAARHHPLPPKPCGHASLRPSGLLLLLLLAGGTQSHCECCGSLAASQPSEHPQRAAPPSPGHQPPSEERVGLQQDALAGDEPLPAALLQPHVVLFAPVLLRPGRPRGTPVPESVRDLPNLQDDSKLSLHKPPAASSASSIPRRPQLRLR